MNPILSALQSGPKRYGELESVIPSPMLDHQLRVLLRDKSIQYVYDTLGVCRFSLPIIEQDERPSVPVKKVPRKTCRACRGLMLLKHFQYDGAEQHICRGCRDSGRNPRLPLRPTCVVCGKRKSLRYFVKEGKAYLQCEECR